MQDSSLQGPGFSSQDQDKVKKEIQGKGQGQDHNFCPLKAKHNLQGRQE